MKNLILSIILAGLGLFCNACVSAYVGGEPNFTEADKPPRPGHYHIWKDGEWVWKRQLNTYIHKEGCWVLPKRNREFIKGHWKITRRGHYWSSGKWR